MTGQADAAAVDAVFSADSVDEPDNGFGGRLSSALVGGELWNQDIGRDIAEQIIRQILRKAVSVGQNGQVAAFAVTSMQIDNQRHISLCV